MTAKDEQLAVFRDLYEKGLLNEAALETALKGLGIDIKDARIGIIGNNAHVEGGIQHGDRTDIDAGGDVAFAKDQGIALILKNLNLSIQTAVDMQKTLRRYLTELAAETDRLPWGQISPEQAGPDQSENLSLSDVYTALDTTEPDRMDCEDDVRECLCRQHEQKRISAQEMINRHDRLVLLGDPGSGKTTLLNFLTHVMACAKSEKEPDVCLNRLKKIGQWDHGPLFPLRILLRDFAAWMEKNKDRNADIGAFLRTTLKENGYADLWPFVHEGLQNKEIPFLVLLDGLDEVPADRRHEMVGMISDFVQTYRYNRYLVTCRIYAYIEPAYRLKNFRQTVLAPFSEEQINDFIDAWHCELAAQKRIEQAEAKELAEKLKSAVKRPELLAMAERPLIMTVMALLHTSYHEMPEDRVELYQWAVELLFRRWKSQAKGEKSLMAVMDSPQLRMKDLEDGLYHAAFYAHSGDSHTEGTADIPEEVLLKQLKPYIGSWDKAEVFVHYIRERAGLLIRHKNDAYTFPHRTFQEFMAACHIAGQKDYPRDAAKLICDDPDKWRIVFVLAAGYARKQQLGNAIASVNKLCPVSISKSKAADKAAFTRAIIGGEALLEIGLVGVKREEDGESILNRVREWLLTAMQAYDVLQPKERVEAGNILSQLGDPRFDPENWYFPAEENMGFVTIPAGEFLMGSDKEKDSEAYSNELPQHTVYLSEYQIAKYPVTVAQFKAFVEDSGYQPEENWKDDNAYANHPVVNASWHDAVAYCEWLTEKLRKKGRNCRITLPTEAQWEKAARGTDGWIYPWGNEPIEPDRANYYDTGIRSTSPAGCFPLGIYGLSDMIGNVWEWCQDWYGEYPAGSVTNPEGSSTGSCRVDRGGGWVNLAVYCRSATGTASRPFTGAVSSHIRSIDHP